MMERLEAHNTLVVQQKKEWGEIVTGFETKNKYVVKSEDGRELYFAAEVGGSVLLRMFLKALRAFTMHIMDAGGGQVLRFERPFRFFFFKLDVYDASGKLLGSVQRRFSLLRRIYDVLDEAGQDIFQLFGPLLHPWTFYVRKDGADVGKITKRWSGLLKEAFTDADNFSVSFPMEAPVTHKAVLLGAVFLIDFAHFENKGK